MKKVFCKPHLFFLFCASSFLAGCGSTGSAPDEAMRVDTGQAAAASDTESINSTNKLIMDSMTQEKPAMASPASIQLPDHFIDLADNSDMIKIPAGEFIYGIDPPERARVLREMKLPSAPPFETEKPKQKITLPTYYMDKYEVTNAQFLKFVKATKHKASKDWSAEVAEHNPTLPVIHIGWPDARAYAAWAGKRLPSEQEWEKGARGTDGRIWPWGNTPNGELYNGSAQGKYAPKPVGSFPGGASPYGIMDMAGNVYEMTTGTWKDTKAMRGGCFLNAGGYSRTMFRWGPSDTILGANWLGFRCVKDSAQVMEYLKGIMK